MNQQQPGASWETEIEGGIKRFINESSFNTLQNKENERAWAEPLVGFANGDDPLYDALKEHVGPFHWTPLEIFKATFSQSDAQAKDLSVICWILPQTERTKADNRDEDYYPSERWARARIFGEEVNVKLREHVVDFLRQAGVEAVAPMLSSLWKRETSPKYGFASTWSERHTAFICGLGTFGLSDGLITPVGKAIRVGSVVAKLNLKATERPYEDHHEYCLFFPDGLCGKCIERCPADAITEEGHDKIKCREHLRPKSADYVKATFGFDGYGCGLCQTGVPCESGIPVK